MRYHYLSRYPLVFAKLTGQRLNEFETLLDDVLPRFWEAEIARLVNRQLASRLSMI